MASQKKQRVKWIASGVKFMGKPFLLIGDKRYDCRHGKDKNVAKKVRYNEKRKVWNWFKINTGIYMKFRPLST